MQNKKTSFSRIKVWSVFVVLFICGIFVGVGIANWNHKIATKKIEQSNQTVIEESLTSCQAIEKVLLKRIWGDDQNCDGVRNDFEIYKKLVAYGCPENHDRFMQNLQNINAVMTVMCVENVIEKPCSQIEQNLERKLGENYVGMDAEQRIDRAKIYAIMAERGCPENAQKYVDLAKKELEIARGISDDKLNQEETLEVVETYKRLKMQNAAEEIFDKAKKITNPAIDFIMQVEKIINE